MKKILLISFVFFIAINVFGQEKKVTFTQFDISIPVVGNKHYNETYTNGSQNKSFLLPDGISSNFGFGIHCNKWVSLAIHSGIDWKISESLVVVPVFTNLKLSPKLGLESTRIVAQLGYGKSFALGRGNLLGNYKKLSLGLQTDDDLLIFIQVAGYEFPLHNQKNIGNLSFGISLITF